MEYQPRPESLKKHPELVDKIKKGNPKAAIRLFCMECYGWNEGETRLCDNLSCPLILYCPGRKAPSKRKISDKTKAALQQGLAKYRSSHPKKPSPSLITEETNGSKTNE